MSPLKTKQNVATDKFRLKHEKVNMLLQIAVQILLAKLLQPPFL